MPKPYDIHRDVVVTLTEQALLETGVENMLRMERLLKEKYSATLEDCYDKPAYLRSVLEEMFGMQYKNVVESLDRKLGQVHRNIGIDNFMKALM